MASKEHLEILEKGVEEWNVWRQQYPDISPDLHGADLSCVDLRCADLSFVDLSGADLSGANFGDRLSFLNSGGAVLRYSDLSEADLSEADLSATTIIATTISDANLARSRIASTILSGLDLRRTKGLGKCRHFGASTIGTDTLFRSKGKIPEVFLKGCGLSDWEIAAAKLHDPDLTSEQVIGLTYEIARIKAESPIQINPIFISYRRTDSNFVEALELQLDKKRLRYWRDVHHMVAGPIEEQVERAIQVNRIVLLVLSKDSVESDWVEWEVKKAHELAKEHKEHVLCPIALDNSWETCGWSGRLRDQVEKYHILDFSKWEDPAEMAVAFQKLIDGLGIYYPSKRQD